MTCIWVLKYCYGNGTNTTMHHFFATKDEAIECAVSYLSSGKYSLGDSPEIKDEMRASLRLRNYYGDDCRCRECGTLRLTYAQLFEAESCKEWVILAHDDEDKEAARSNNSDQKECTTL